MARPEHSAVYEGADLVRQAATLCFGFIKNHPWVGGNKRTATALVDEFLFRNGFEITASLVDVLELVFAVEAGHWEALEIDQWLRQHVSRRQNHL